MAYRPAAAVCAGALRPRAVRCNLSVGREVKTETPILSRVDAYVNEMCVNRRRGARQGGEGP